ncbi:serine hydrolase domain-containing protein [Anditalea andensis]|uniref:Beta-lactamase-related domain-containing protein n=1 Tax=Anditalea andensis TaxID=1048983 RepID=A0A074KP72_9BACT|nr:serine hydrolase domain-containing protein [Anditalea andensis]KEO71736.1 hypothetical protein EL17_21355 [Anditalea andensis]
MKKLLGIALASLFCIPLLAQGPEQVNLLLDRWEEDQTFMGEILIMKNDETVLHRHIGFRNVDKEMPHDNGSTFTIGGISQAFTAVLVLKAVEEDKLTLDTTIDTLLPQLPNSNLITIRHLLEHRSGLADYTDYLPAYQNSAIGTTLEKLIIPLEVSEHEFLPGQKQQLRNTNYLVLSYILEKTYDKDYQTLLEDKITSPNSLNNTFLTTVNASKLRSKSSGHLLIGKELRPQPATHPLFTAGASGINSNATDLANFFLLMWNEKLLNKQSLSLMQADRSNDNSGMGLSEMNVLGKKTLGYDGNINGFESSLLYFLNDKVTLVILMNRTDASYQDKLNEIGEAYFGASPLPAPMSTPIEAEKPKPTASNAVITGTYAFNPKLKITVFKEGSDLKARTASQPATTLVKEGPLIYKIKGTEGKIRFVTENDEVTHLIFEQTGFQQKAIKE